MNSYPTVPRLTMSLNGHLPSNRACFWYVAEATTSNHSYRGCYLIMTHDREIGAENRETLRDEHAQAKSSLAARQRSSHLGRWIVNSYKAVAIVTLNTLILFACLEGV
jgi:hypothetical protein